MRGVGPPPTETPNEEYGVPHLSPAQEYGSAIISRPTFHNCCKSGLQNPTVERETADHCAEIWSGSGRSSNRLEYTYSLCPKKNYLTPSNGIILAK